MAVKTLRNWILSDRVFFPHSIYSIGDSSKVVLIVSGEGQIYTLVIKNLQHNIQSGEIPHKISRIMLREPQCNLVETVVTSTNTVSCKDDGELVVFTSFRECTIVEDIEGVKAICSIEDGKKLLLIRLIRGKKLQLEMYNDLCGCQIGDCLKCFDLSWDKHDVEASRNSQVYKIKTFVVDGVNLKFFKRFLNFKDLLEGTELMLFTMDNGLFWLKTYEDTYEIVTVKLCTAIIVDFDFASSTGCFAVLLANAVMYINSISEDADSLLIQENKIHLGPILLSHLFINELSTIICSSDSKITQIRYYYSELTKTIQFIVKDIPIIGVTGITYLGFAEMVICVTENRLFYSLPIHLLTDLSNNQHKDCFEITSKVLSQANQMTSFLINEMKADKRIALEIDKEHLQVDILTNAFNQNLYDKFMEAQMKFLKELPHHVHSTINLSESNGSCLLVQIDIIFSNGIKELFMRQKNWMLILLVDEQATQIPLSKINGCNENFIQLLVSLDRFCLPKRGLTHIEINLSIQIRHFQDSVVLDIPMNIKNHDNIAELFDVLSFNPITIAIKERHYLDVAGDLIRHYENLPEFWPQSIKYKLNNLTTVSNVGELLQRIGIKMNQITADKMVEKAYLKLGNQTCEILRDGLSDYIFETTSPGMMFLLKLLCSRKRQTMNRVNEENYKAFRLKLLQCETERELIASHYQQIRAVTGSMMFE